MYHRIINDISMTIKNNLGKGYLYTTINSINIQCKNLIIIECIPTPDVCFLKDAAGNENLYVRKGISTHLLRGSQIIDFNNFKKNTDEIT